MSKLALLKSVTSKRELASLLGVKASFLTHTLYVRSIDSQYFQFQIPKRSGGKRTISAPGPELKDLQSRLSDLLLDCVDEINKAKKITSSLSHGFARGRSIITNAETHLNSKNLLNIDLKDFFDGFNFGRVRGFFLKNRNFLLYEDVATAIAKIACFNNALPQGSPCSPVITNLITHALDIRLASLAEVNSCIYSRYADDITLSTRLQYFPASLVRTVGREFRAGRALKREIKRADFSINEKKTRLQFKDSRQDVTGLVVNKKVNTKSEYWRTTRAMCHQIFMTGSFVKKSDSGDLVGNVNELYGRLNFIDSIDKYNHVKPKGAPDNKFQPKNHGIRYRELLNVRERTFSKFLYYWYFYGNTKPTVLCEGKTDNIYLKSAINMLAKNYAMLASPKTKTSPYELLVNFVEYSDRTRFLLDLHGGCSYLKKFVERFSENWDYYKAPRPDNPVILLLDNDAGPLSILNYLEKNSGKYPGCPDNKDDMRKSDFIYVAGNLYIILVPLKNSGEFSEMEDFFDAVTRGLVVNGKYFDPTRDGDTKSTYGKNTFANKVVKEKKASISFVGFTPILDKIARALEHYKRL